MIGDGAGARWRRTLAGMTLDEPTSTTGRPATTAPTTPPRPVRTAAVLLVVIAVLELAIVATNFVIPSLGRQRGLRRGHRGQLLRHRPAGGGVDRGVLRLGPGGPLRRHGPPVRSGRTWPRTVTIVLAAPGVLSVLLTAVGAAVSVGTGGSLHPLVTLVLQLLALAAQVAVVMLLFRALSRRWLADRTAARRLDGSHPAGA